MSLRILPEFGGQSRIGGKYSASAPELIVEEAVSCYSRDFGVKKRLYAQMGVREYLIVGPHEERFIALTWTSSGCQPLDVDLHGVFRSSFFPCLWLDTKAVWDLDLQHMNGVLQQGLATPRHAEFASALAAKKS